MSDPTPPVPEDARDLLRCLASAGVDFLVVGAHALAAHGVPRYTGDFDVLVRPDPETADKVLAALRAFGAPVGAHGLTADDLATPGTVYQLGLPPRRIDILTGISGVSFDEAWADRRTTRLGDAEVPVLGLGSLVRNKRATGRTKDLLDVELLREAGAPVDDPPPG